MDLDEVIGLAGFDRRLVCVPDHCPADCEARTYCRYQHYLKISESVDISIQICNHNYLLADAIHIFDFQEDVIRPEGLNKGWQTSGSSCLTRLAFNLWNGWNTDGCATPYDLFITSDAGYMLEAIRIRYPEYCREAQVPSKGEAR